MVYSENTLQPGFRCRFLYLSFFRCRFSLFPGLWFSGGDSFVDGNQILGAKSAAIRGRWRQIKYRLNTKNSHVASSESTPAHPCALECSAFQYGEVWAHYLRIETAALLCTKRRHGTTASHERDEKLFYSCRTFQWEPPGESDLWWYGAIITFGTDAALRVCSQGINQSLSVCTKWSRE